MSKKLTGKIGYCDNRSLRLKDKQGRFIPGGHYVYIRNDNKNGTCDVNVVTSLEDKNRTYSENKLKQVRSGNTYAIPKYDANFNLWSGITKTPISNVKTSSILYVGKKKIRKRHKFFIGKFLK